MFDKPARAQAWREKRLRILIFNWRDTKHVFAGGAEVYIHELAKNWVKDGNSVTIFSGNDNRNSSTETVNGINIIRRGGTYTVYFFAAIYYLVSLRRNHDIIIDCENGIPFFTPLYARKPIFLLVHHVHQDIFRSFLRFPLRQIAGALEGKLMPLLYWNKRVITVSESSKKEIAALGFIRPDNITVIHNGVEEAKPHTHEKTSYPSFSYLGRLKDYKNVDVAIKAFAYVVAEYPSAKFIIAGTGESFDKLDNLVNNYNLQDSVKFLGRISESQKAELLAESWVMLQPSQMEGWGISVIEANTYGTPVIASRVNGLKDSVKDTVTGLLVTAGDVKGFAEAMKLLASNDMYRTQLGYAAYAWSQNFRWERSAELFYELIGRSLTERFFRLAFGRMSAAK